MKKIITKHQIILLIVGIISIVCGFIILSIYLKNYNTNKEFINNSIKTDAIVFNVRSVAKNKYSFEYKYVVNNIEYKNYISSMKFKNTLQENDTITIYYNKNKVNENIINRQSKKTSYLTILCLIILFGFGVIDLIKYFKK